MTDAFVAQRGSSRASSGQHGSSRATSGRYGASRVAPAWNQLRRAARAITAAAFATAATLAPGGADAQGVVRETFNDWQLRCEKPAGAAAEHCALVQNVAAADRPNVTLLVIILDTADGKGRLLRVLAPLGVLLPAGLGLKIDQTDIGRAGFVRCLPTGCVAEVVMDDSLTSRLKEGKVATFVVFQTPEEGIGVPVTLEGLDRGLAALK
ncbi:invasion associated locus B family protein [Camelimonas abortus]|uniref:Invasion associated locus B family protein n=1 Tax=Camelimonas abortus TaxID=1017184 RepID=A0ABV7LFZ3_9HYPH